MDAAPPGDQAQEIARREQVLAKLTPLVTERVAIPLTDIVFEVTRPADIDALLDDAMDDPEQNLPYWAEIWPSGIALAATLLHDPDLVRGLPVIEMGSGIGITAAAAMLAGAQLTITDYSAHSLLLAEITCLRAGVALPVSRQLNWRDAEAHLQQDSGERWPVVLAADVLYEERDIEPVLDVLARMLAPGGTVVLAEPGRRPARLAMERARARGWRIETQQHTGPWPDPKDRDVSVAVHTMQLPPAAD